jgi:two-component system, cell cycle sensor histidine kinase and response regulator CckA
MLTILIVEDEPIVRNVIIRVLEREDYALLEAASADEALQLSDSFDGTIDLLIADHALKTTTTGAAVAAQIRQVRPGLKILHTSGHPLNKLLQEGALIPGANFLAKPFSAKILAEKVKQVLGPKS